MPCHNDWWSAFDVIKPWRRQWIALVHSRNWNTFGRRFCDAAHRRGRCLLPGGTGLQPAAMAREMRM